MCCVWNFWNHVKTDIYHSKVASGKCEYGQLSIDQIIWKAAWTENENYFLRPKGPESKRKCDNASAINGSNTKVTSVTKKINKKTISHI